MWVGFSPPRADSAIHLPQRGRNLGSGGMRAFGAFDAGAFEFGAFGTVEGLLGFLGLLLDGAGLDELLLRGAEAAGGVVVAFALNLGVGGLAVGGGLVVAGHGRAPGWGAPDQPDGG